MLLKSNLSKYTKLIKTNINRKCTHNKICYFLSCKKAITVFYSYFSHITTTVYARHRRSRIGFTQTATTPLPPSLYLNTIDYLSENTISLHTHIHTQLSTVTCCTISNCDYPKYKKLLYKNIILCIRNTLQHITLQLFLSLVWITVSV